MVCVCIVVHCRWKSQRAVPCATNLFIVWFSSIGSNLRLRPSSRADKCKMSSFAFDTISTRCAWVTGFQTGEAQSQLTHLVQLLTCLRKLFTVLSEVIFIFTKSKFKLVSHVKISIPTWIWSFRFCPCSNSKNLLLDAYLEQWLGWCVFLYHQAGCCGSVINQ